MLFLAPREGNYPSFIFPCKFIFENVFCPDYVIIFFFVIDPKYG